MNTLTRKQREIADRHALFLVISQRLIASEGFGNLSMDRIAELAEYSKGTVYQHFSCKEEILIQLCNANATLLKDLFARATQFTGGTREKLMAIVIAHELWMALNPNCDELMQSLRAGVAMEKVSEESREQHVKLELEIVALVASLFEQAVANKDLKLPEGSKIPEYVFGFWSLCHGGLQLRSLNLPLQSMGVEDPYRAMLNIVHAALDGLNWKPLSREHNYQASAARICSETFKSEIEQLPKSEQQFWSVKH